MKKFFILWLCFSLCCQGVAAAESLQKRLANYPNWSGFPSVETVQMGDDLIYPQWMAGTWYVTSTLIEQIAPLAPEIMTPGFEQNRQLIDRPFEFLVRFKPQQNFFSQALRLPKVILGERPIVADRAFNGLEIARAYLGETVKSVKVDPQNPNRQLTQLSGDRLLISTVTGRSAEAPNDLEFLSSEVTQQQFQGTTQVYLNQVETTTDYHQKSAQKITANQVTAIYLSPNDPNFFHAQNQPVALYRYQLVLERVDN